MAISFPIPSAHSKSVITIDNFLGADFTNSPANVDDNKSPNLKNLIRDVPGKVRKCMGYETVESYNEDYFNQFVYKVIGRIIDNASIQTGVSLYVSYHRVDDDYNSMILNVGIVNETHADVVLSENTYVFDADSTDQANLQDLYEVSNGEPLNTYKFTDVSGDTSDTCTLFVDENNGEYALHLRVSIPDGMVAPGDANNSLSTDLCNFRFSRYAHYGMQFQDSVKINGSFKLRHDEKALYHVGNYLIRDNKILYSDANDQRSKGWEFDEHLYIVDGKRLLKYGIQENKSDTRYKSGKTNNNVIVGEEVTLVIARFDSKQNILQLIEQNTTSENGRFEVSEDKRRITYTDTVDNVGDVITYSCTYKYRKKSSGSSTTVVVSDHTLTGIAEKGEYIVAPADTDAYTPLVTISKDPEGGGEPYEDINLLNPAFIEQFLGKPSATEYNLSFTELDETEPIVEVLNPDGEWEEWTYGTDYTCDYEQGIITFTRAPGESPVTGEDNIKVTAYRTVDDYSDRINKCTIGALFGVSGAMDRLFLSGNPDYINYDWYSAQYDPTYFADTSYSVLGSSGSAIIGYSIVSNYLAAHKDKYERDQNIILREGDLVESEPSFRIINTLQGAGAVAPFSFAYLATEPVFLTNQGVYAVTAQDVTGEKYAQNRSYFLDGKLLEEENLADAYGFVFNDMYWLCLNDVAYILDGLQPIQTDKSMPYATRQYVGFYRTNLPAYTMWENDGRLFFGTEDGKICRFFKDKYALESYNDDGEPIECIWETPDIIGKLFFKNKTLSHVAIKLDSAIAASVNIYVMNRGIWEFVRTDHWRARIFQFSKEVFSKHTFSCDKTQKVIPKKLRVKKVDKFRLRLTNNELNESFALYDIGFEYTETSNYMR